MQNCVEVVDCGIETGWERMRIDAEGGVRAAQAAVERGVEERGPHAIGREGVAQAARRTADDTVEPKSAEIIGHCTGAVAGEIATE